MRDGVLVMSITIIFGLLCLVLQGGNFEALIHGVQLPAGVEIEKHDTGELSFERHDDGAVLGSWEIRVKGETLTGEFSGRYCDAEVLCG